MTNRENVLRALRRDNPERVPFEFVLCPSHIDEFKKRTGKENYLEYYNFPIRYVELNQTRKKTDFTVYYDMLPSNARTLDWNPEWGVMGVAGSKAHYQKMLHPMAHFETIEEINSYPYPDFNKSYRWEGLPEKVNKIKDNDLIAVAFMQMTIFEIAWYLRGMDNLMIDMMVNKDLVESLLDRITEIRVEMARKYAYSGVDILMLGDDVSTQLDMMINPELWSKMLKPRMEEIINSAKHEKPDILVFYHGDGNLKKIIPDLIDIGVDVLNPVQPECMDPIELKRLYGNNLSFWGTLGTQSTLPFGTPKEIEETCRHIIENVGINGGLLMAPTHVIEPDVPWENVKAFINAVKKYGMY